MGISSLYHSNPENGQTMMLYLGRSVSPLFLNDLFGPNCNSLADLDPLNSSLPEIEGQLSLQVRNIIAYIRQSRPSRSLQIQITRQTLDGAEHEFNAMLVEDRNNESQSYLEYLAYLHKQVAMEVCPLRLG
jgi:protein transport protein SEC24